MLTKSEAQQHVKAANAFMRAVRAGKISPKTLRGMLQKTRNLGVWDDRVNYPMVPRSWKRGDLDHIVEQAMGPMKRNNAYRGNVSLFRKATNAAMTPPKKILNAPLKPAATPGRPGVVTDGADAVGLRLSSKGVDPYFSSAQNAVGLMKTPANAVQNPRNWGWSAGGGQGGWLRHELGHWADASIARTNPQIQQRMYNLGNSMMQKLNPQARRWMAQGNSSYGPQEFVGQTLAARGSGRGAGILRQRVAHNWQSAAADKATRIHGAESGIPSAMQHLERNYMMPGGVNTQTRSQFFKGASVLGSFGALAIPAATSSIYREGLLRPMAEDVGNPFTNAARNLILRTKGLLQGYQPNQWSGEHGDDPLSAAVTGDLTDEQMSSDIFRFPALLRRQLVTAFNGDSGITAHELGHAQQPEWMKGRMYGMGKVAPVPLGMLAALFRSKGLAGASAASAVPMLTSEIDASVRGINESRKLKDPHPLEAAAGLPTYLAGGLGPAAVALLSRRWRF